MNIYLKEQLHLHLLSSHMSKLNNFLVLLIITNFGSNYLNTHKVYSTLVRLLYGCGLRISEALSLKISDIDFTNNIIHVFHSKNNVSRIVCMSNSLSEVVKSYITSLNISEIWLFPSPKGRPLLSRYYTRFF